MPEYKIHKEKIVFNADFEPSLDFFSKQIELMKALKVDFPNWELSSLNFTMQDKDNNCTGTFTHNKIIYEIDNANSKVDLTKKKIINGLKFLNDALTVKSFKRLGIRFFMFIPMVEMKKEELSEIVQSKLFLNNEETIDIFAKESTDLVYIIDYSKDNFLYHVKCGPMPKEHIPNWVDFSGGKQRFKTTNDFKEYLESLPEMSFFIDIDCYNHDVDFSDTEMFVNKAVSNCLETSAKLKKYVLGA